MSLPTPYYSRDGIMKGDSMAKKPVPAPDVAAIFAGRPTSPGPPRKRVFPAVTLIGVEALAVGQIVDQLEDTIRVLLGKLGDMPWTAVTRADIEAAISEAERTMPTRDKA